jgi:hypothetical protein
MASSVFKLAVPGVSRAGSAPPGFPSLPGVLSFPLDGTFGWQRIPSMAPLSGNGGGTRPAFEDMPASLRRVVITARISAGSRASPTPGKSGKS